MALLVLCLPLLGSCKSRVEYEEPHHVGAKINISDFIKNTATYKGRAIMLPLKLDEPVVPGQVQSLQNHVGREVKFTTRGPKGERLDLFVKIPDGLSVPEVGNSGEVFVTFVCTRGMLRQGNEARAIQAR
jgi:hypothetical protein